MPLALAAVALLVACAPASPSASPRATAAAAGWRRVTDIPTPRSEVAAAVFRGVVYVSADSEAGTSSRRTCPTAGRRRRAIRSRRKWTRSPELPTSRHGLGVVGVVGTLYALSGGPAPGVSQTPVREALDVR